MGLAKAAIWSMMLRACAVGRSLGEALESGLSDLDGFYTFVVGTI